uniref:Tc1-like transposase DDE domain-containing protein n=1 Tax=Electrophorus electricus TaxID=8005 RepID=A0A4W4GMT5_ELEEL
GDSRDHITAHLHLTTQGCVHNSDLDILPWPANTPDLNPVEHIWEDLDHRVGMLTNAFRHLV